MGSIVSAILDPITGASETKAAASTAADQQRQAAQQASYAAQFRPVGMTSAFGTSQFTREIDPVTGMPYVSSAGYTAAPQLSSLQSNIMGGLGSAYTQGQDLSAQYAPLSRGAASAFQAGDTVSGYAPTVAGYAANVAGYAPTVAGYGSSVAGYAPQLFTQGQGLFNQGQNLFTQGQGVSSQAGALFNTGASYLASPEQAQAQYIANTQAALAPSQEQALARIRNQLFQTGRSGLATGGTQAGGMAAANPELAAYYNSLAQQDLNITQQAQEQARQNVMLGANLYGQGGSLSAQGAGITGQGAGITSQGSGLFGQGSNLYSSAGNLYGQSAGLYSTAADLLGKSSDFYGQGTNLYAQGGNLLNLMSSGQANAYSPFQTQLGLSQQIESMSQQPYQLGLQLGQASQGGQTTGAGLYNQGMGQAAGTQYGGVQAGNAANVSLVSGLLQAGAMGYGSYKR